MTQALPCKPSQFRSQSFLQTVPLGRSPPQRSDGHKSARLGKCHPSTIRQFVPKSRHVKIAAVSVQIETPFECTLFAISLSCSLQRGPALDLVEHTRWYSTHPLWRVYTADHDQKHTLASEYVALRGWPLGRVKSIKVNASNLMRRVCTERPWQVYSEPTKTKINKNFLLDGKHKTYRNRRFGQLKLFISSCLTGTGERFSCETL